MSFHQKLVLEYRNTVLDKRLDILTNIHFHSNINPTIKGKSYFTRHLATKPLDAFGKELILNPGDGNWRTISRIHARLKLALQNVKEAVRCWSKTGLNKSINLGNYLLPKLSPLLIRLGLLGQIGL